MKRLLLLLLLLLSPAISRGECPELSQDFLNYIKVCENGIRKGWNESGQKWFPYHDGSSWHIAYGHKIKAGEFRSGITETQAQAFLISDLHRAYRQAQIHFQRKGWDISALSSRSLEIVLDFTFNGCLLSHPKMMNHVVQNNIEGQRLEYKRFAVLNGQRKELKDRNTRFYARYLTTN